MQPNTTSNRRPINFNRPQRCRTTSRIVWGWTILAHLRLAVYALAFVLAALVLVVLFAATKGKFPLAKAWGKLSRFAKSVFGSK
jgi:hypothetical protein